MTDGSGDGGTGAVPAGGGDLDRAGDAADRARALAGGDEAVVRVVEESLTLGKRVEVTGRVRVSTPVDVVEEVLSGEFERVDVEVERVPVGREVDAVPDVRVEGDVTVLPVVEERLVVVRRLVLVEEVRVRRSASTRSVEQPAERRVQRVVVERLPGDGGMPAVGLAAAGPGSRGAVD